MLESFELSRGCCFGRAPWTLKVHVNALDRTWLLISEKETFYVMFD